MTKCIEPHCDEDCKPTEVIGGVQIQECTYGHRWGIVAGANAEKVRRQVKSQELSLLDNVA